MRMFLIACCACVLVGMQGRPFPGDEVYTRPGQIVTAPDGARLNMYCMGTGSPTVIFESGWEDWAPAWSLVQSRVAQWTRACSYDRAGAGFSGPGPMPRTGVRIAEELHGALHLAGINGPYILVGHAFGGDPVRTFADLYLPDVAGVVLVEADASDLEPQAMQDADHEGAARILAGLRECRDSVAVGKPLPRVVRSGRADRTCAQQFFRGLPEAAWSPELNASLLHRAETQAVMYDAFISEMAEMPSDEAWLQQHHRSLGSRPLRVLTTGNHGVGHLPASSAQDPAHLEEERQITLAQSRWLDLSSNARQLFIPESSEYIQFDRPEAVVGAIRDVYDLSGLGRTQRAPGNPFHDCADCPDMVEIPAGTFVMGSSALEKSWAVSQGASPKSVADEGPQHEVSLRSFALGARDVTRGEYAAFVRATGHSAGDGCGHDGATWVKDARKSWRSPGFNQTDRDPVVCISWHDAQAYVAWLNGKVRRGAEAAGDGPYRLPSESEWEYAARAGTITRFSWGDDDAGASSHAWYLDNSGSRTHPVGAKPANRFGLADMAGDVWQWTQDCYAESFAGAPADGSAAKGAVDCLRVDRGGSWFYPAWLLRPATRERNPADYRDMMIGFRVARGVN
jgi:formylglycine-generating enzyme required for sulfatase activity